MYNKLGKYYGNDLNAPIYEIGINLSDLYQDITSVEDFMIIGVNEMGLSDTQCRDYSTDYINSVGVENMTQRDIDFATSIGLL